MRIGDKAPDFELLDQNQKPRRLSRELGEKGAVLIFYPYDQSPTCTRQLCAVNQELGQFYLQGLNVLGINNAESESHQRFSQRRFLTLPLLSDINFTVSRDYKALFEIGPIRVIRRTVVGVDRHGIIRLYQRGFPANSSLIGTIGLIAPAK
jgi:thioredoxin-dependent peroxiredoxin